ncbi:MAG: PLP-dependent aminotransferase family protein [Turicibacter sp.]
MFTVPIQLDKNNEVPLYLQLMDILKKRIELGEFKSQQMLPSIRKMAVYLDVNTSTVIQAYKQLELENIVRSKRGSGYFVSDHNFLTYQASSLCESRQDMTKGCDSFSKYTINFAGATPHSNLFPIPMFQKYINHVFERDQALAFGYQEVHGYEALRESFCEYLKRYSQLNTKSSDIQIISGAQQGIDLISKVLVNPNDEVMLENRTYYGAIGAFQSRCAQLIGISLESDGLDLLELENKLKKHKPKLLYVMTKFQNPTTTTYSISKMKKLVELAEQYNFYIVEEDSISELIYHQAACVPPLKYFDRYDRVIYIKSFSKLMMPGLRIGFMIVPTKLQSEIIKAKHYTDISSSGLIQRAVDLFLRTGEFDEYIETLRQDNKKKYELMLSKLNELKEYGINFEIPSGGLYFWVKFPSHINVNHLYELCQEKKLKLTPGRIFNVFEMNDDSYMRLSFAACTEQEINRGFFIIKECMKSVNLKEY